MSANPKGISGHSLVHKDLGTGKSLEIGVVRGKHKEFGTGKTNFAKSLAEAHKPKGDNYRKIDQDADQQYYRLIKG